MTSPLSAISLEATIVPQPPIWVISLGAYKLRFREVSRLDCIIKLEEIRSDERPQRTMLIAQQDASTFAGAFSHLLQPQSATEITVIAAQPSLHEEILDKLQLKAAA